METTTEKNPCILDQNSKAATESNNNELNTVSVPPSSKNDKCYQDAKKYWSNISPTVDGMLGGFASISFTDIRASDQFLKNLYKLKPAPGKMCALDCGAGIGRVSKNLLIPVFAQVDLVEQDEKFAQTAKRDLYSSGKLGTVFNQGLQDFSPEECKYDVIWSQWVLGHLTDDDTVEFLTRCLKGLKRNGVIVIKENFTTGTRPEPDKQDASVTRPLPLMKKLLSKGGFRVIKEQKQKDFPRDLYPVYMLAMKPVINE
ncbi:N-terminal Xaa-Pro-Lys N-methyltransferase 1-B [Malaya genurostris]|uniref:N-terminal Xaa-Pro-Lys N-methyltransferase 1-B n=1 Tax=Malaya genurostris TaxID=325434 RepID=UPI0026F3C1A5|nr:N-terminal Xaa-Pro-Lys N-methyltransferase 1-B [Malaya genurostris]XP_058459456.1 N-terminal Xaa-Pro-Lys N-methyltransferase 1-B [Malaya genurostris]